MNHTVVDACGGQAIRLLAGLSLRGQLLALSQLRLLLDHSARRQLTQLLLSVRCANRVVMGSRLVYLLYLASVVLYMLQHLVRILRF